MIGAEEKQGLVLPIIILIVGLLVVFQFFYRSPQQNIVKTEDTIALMKKTAEGKQTVKVTADANTKNVGDRAVKDTNTLKILQSAGVPGSAIKSGNSGYNVKMTGNINQLADIVSEIAGSVVVTDPSGQLAGQPPILQVSRIRIEPVAGGDSQLKFTADRIR